MNWIMIIGLGAAFCTTFSFLPQVIKVVKTRHTKDLSLGMYVIFVIGVALWLTYGIMSHDFPVTIANIVTLMFAVTILGYKIRYK